MIAIIRKDMREWFAGGATGRYGQYEFLIYIALFGIVFPIFFSVLGTEGPKSGASFSFSPFIGAFVPILLAIYTMADAFAGEKERGTLETLLVTPLSSSDIVVGKWLAGISYAAVIMVSTTILSSIVSRVLGARSVDPRILAVTVAIALLLAGLLGAIEIIISMRAPTVKSAVFALNLTFIIIVVGLSQLLLRTAKTITVFLAPVLALGSTGLVALGAGVILLVLVSIALLLWIATQQLRGMRLE